MSFELVEFCEPAPVPGARFPGTTETVLGTYETEGDAVKHGRTVWRQTESFAHPRCRLVDCACTR